MTEISVCVPVYRAHAEPNLSTLAASLAGALDGLDGELVVALNGVTASSLDVADGTRTVDLGVNRGVAPGWNAAARAAAGDVLVFTNDDVVLGPRSLATLRRALDEPDAGVVGPAGARWDLGHARHLANVELSSTEVGAVERCDAVAGFLFAVRREVFDAVDGFDEAYAPCSFEEVDFCAAVTHRLGLTAYAVGGVAVEHVWGISRRSAPWKRVRFEGRSESLRSIHRRNRRHFLAKWGDRA